jgi:perosamine synthetase
MNIPLGTFATTPKIRSAVNAVLDSGRLSYGPVSREYESRFAALHGCGYGVASNSGTSSLVVAIQALKELHGWQDGDEVIVPALTFVATVNAVLHNRLTPVLVDVNSFTYNIDVSKIEEAITERTRCILPVHLFGQPADMMAIKRIAGLHNLRIIEDSCETVLSTYCGQSVGSMGDIGCFSTYVAHHLVTGVGGMATTNNPDYARKMRSLVNHGIDLAELPNGEEYDPSFLARKFRFTSIGHSFRITELEAAIGLAQLDTLTDAICSRQRNAKYLIDGLQQITGIIRLPTTRFGATHSYMVFPFVLYHGSKWPLMAHLQKYGVECREMVPLTCQPCYIYDERLWPCAKWINESGIYMSCTPDLTMKQLDYMIDTLVGYFNHER